MGERCQRDVDLGFLTAAVNVPTMPRVKRDWQRDATNRRALQSVSDLHARRTRVGHSWLLALLLFGADLHFFKLLTSLHKSQQIWDHANICLADSDPALPLFCAIKPAESCHYTFSPHTRKDMWLRCWPHISCKASPQSNIPAMAYKIIQPLNHLHRVALAGLVIIL